MASFEEQNAEIMLKQDQFKEVQHPNELDAATKNAKIPAYLLNFYLATLVDLAGLGSAVYIPVQITEREGGRKSIYFLDQNEEVLAGIYVTGDGIALRFVKRMTGSSLPAEPGDRYSTRITDRAENLVFEDQAVLWKFDPLTGTGHFDVSAPSTATGTPQLSAKSVICLFGSPLTYSPDRWPWFG